MINVYVTPEQLAVIKDLVSEWDSHARWLPKLDQYLWDEKIHARWLPELDRSLWEENIHATSQQPTWMESYRFLAGGVDHIEEDSHSVTIHDRCMQTGGETLDGSMRFTFYMTEADTPIHGDLTDDDLIALYHEGAKLTQEQWDRIEKIMS